MCLLGNSVCVQVAPKKRPEWLEKSTVCPSSDSQPFGGIPEDVPGLSEPAHQSKRHKKDMSEDGEKFWITMVVA